MTGSAASEAELIARIRLRAARHPDLVIGIGDDAAVMRGRPGTQLVASTDTLIEGVHFDERFTPTDLGHLALASSLSDLAAMGATPRWVLLSLTLPHGDLNWVDAFLDGFLPLATAHGVVLAGGNLTRGPLNITVHVLGEVASGQAITRQGVCDGDLLAVTGTLGDAAAALLGPSAARETLWSRLTRPTPRIVPGRALAGQVHGMMDISDGLAADLPKMVLPPLGACIELDALPVSTPLATAITEPEKRWKLQLGGGSDYELLIAFPPDSHQTVQALSNVAGTPVTVIGKVDDSGVIRYCTPAGKIWSQTVAGWDHFR